MVTRQEFKTALNDLDKKERLCFLYIEEYIETRIQGVNTVIGEKINTPFDPSSLYRDINGLKEQIKNLQNFKKDIKELIENKLNEYVEPGKDLELTLKKIVADMEELKKENYATIDISQELKDKLEKESKKQNLTVNQLITDAVIKNQDKETLKKKMKIMDPYYG